MALTVKDLLFSADAEQVTIYPDPSFEPKTVDELQRRASVVFEAYYPAPSNREEERYHLSCPVRALRIYHTCTAPVHRSDRLWV